jgi:hypothetical protein
LLPKEKLQNYLAMVVSAKNFSSSMKVLFVVTTLIASISDIVGNSNYKGYTYLKTLLLQHLEDIGDRELEKFLAETTIAK